MAHPFIFLCAKPLGHQNRKATGQTVQPSGHKEHQRTRTPNRCQGPHAQELAGDDGIGHVIELLEHIAQKHGHHKMENQLHGASHRHIMHFSGCIFTHFQNSSHITKLRNCSVPDQLQNFYLWLRLHIITWVPLKIQLFSLILQLFFLLS